MTNNTILIGGAVVFKDLRGKRYFMLVKQGDEDRWEIAKVTVRKGESSVRAVLRMTGEIGGMNTRVLEEAGRTSAVVTLNGRLVNQKYFYYLMLYKSSGEEILGFTDHKWVEYSKAVKMVFLKRERDIFRQAKEVLKEWEKKHNKKK